MADVTIAEIVALLRRYAPEQEDALVAAVDGVAGLYQRGWRRWLPCETHYHDLKHALEVTLLTLKLQVGFMLERDQDAEQGMTPLCLAALLHDSGYLMTQDEPRGVVGGAEIWSGGQHTFDHVARGGVLAQELLHAQGWDAGIIEQVRDLIQSTEFVPALQIKMDPDPYMQHLQRILKTADLLAQVAALDYVERLKDLYAEFVEAYAAVGKDSLRLKGIHVYDSFSELMRGSAGFLRQRVIPVLHELGCMDTYLPRFYAEQSGAFSTLTPYHLQLRRNVDKLEAWLAREDSDAPDVGTNQT